MSCGSGCGLLIDLTGGDAPGRPDSGAASDASAGDASGGTDASRLDAAPAGDAFVIDLEPAGASTSHPAVAWTGTEFAVSSIAAAATAGTGYPQLRRYPPGVPSVPLVQVLRPDPVPISSTSIAADLASGAIAVGWIDGSEPSFAFDGALVEGREVTGFDPFGPVTTTGDDHDGLVIVQGGAVHALVRQRDGTGEHMIHLSYGSVGALGPPTSHGPVVSNTNLWEVTPSRIGELTAIAVGRYPMVWTFDGTTWSLLRTIAGLSESSEGSVASRGSATVVLFTHTIDNVLASGPIDRAPGPLAGWRGPDPGLAAFERGFMASWVRTDTSSPTRNVALAVLDDTGAPTAATTCVIPAMLPYANEPSIACGGGWCAVVWIEGSEPRATDFVTRLAQFPAGDPSALCP